MRTDSDPHHHAFQFPDAQENQSATRFYDHPRWYDIIHQRGTTWEVGFLRKQAHRWVETGCRHPSEQSWLEPACGTGRYLRNLAKYKYHLTGYDLNRRSLQYAQRKTNQRGLDIEFITASMTEYRNPHAFDFAFNPINTFRHLQSEAEALRHLQLTAESLKPGGAYLLGIDIVDYDIPEPLEETWTVKYHDCEVTHFMTTIPPERNQRLEQIINHITVRTRNREFQFESTYELLTYDLQEWQTLIAASPFMMVDSHDFSNEPITINHHTRDMNVTLQLK